MVVVNYNEIYTLASFVTDTCIKSAEPNENKKVEAQKKKVKNYFLPYLQSKSKALKYYVIASVNAKNKVSNFHITVCGTEPFFTLRTGGCDSPKKHCSPSCRFWFRFL